MIYIYHVLIAMSVVFKVSLSFNGVFWHICDIHLNSSYSNSHKNQEPLGNYNIDSSYSLVISAINEMKSKYENPDFIIWNGDSVYHGRMTDSSFFDTIKNVSVELRKKFPTTNILPSLGNHDLNPSSVMNNDFLWCNKMYLYWKNFLNSAEIDTFKQGCFYSRIINGTTRAIVLNTIAWYSVNTFTAHIKDPFNQFVWLESELKNARKSNEKVFLIGHVPPGSSEYSPNQYRHLHPQFNERLVHLMQNHSDIIDAGFFSHQHTDSFKIVYSTTGSPVIPLFLSPSVSPMNLRGMGSINPSIRLYKWSYDPDNRFYEQYHTTLPTKQSSQSVLKWSLEYTSTNLLPRLSAASMTKLLKDFTVNSSKFDLFFRQHLSGRHHDGNVTCPVNSTCRCEIVCGMEFILYDALDRCLSRCPNSQVYNLLSSLPSLSVSTITTKSTQVPMIISVIVVFTVILIATVVGVNKVYCHQRRSASLTRDIYMATYNGQNCEEIVEDHIDHIAVKTFGDVPEYRGHMRNNSRTILTLNDGNEPVDVKSQQSVSKFAISKKDKPQEKYDYSRM